MFDPTAYENMKVVIEGSLYDLDLDGQLMILDRNDIVNLAKLSRSYEVTFSKQGKHSVSCTFKLSAELDNLAAELLPFSQSEAEVGAHILISFQLQHPNERRMDEWIEKELKKIWGQVRSYKQVISYNPFSESNNIKKEIFLDFNRLIFEEQVDDLEAMIEYMILSLEKLEELGTVK